MHIVYIILFCIAFIMITYSILREVIRWKEAYDERERITKHIMEFKELIYD